MEGIFRVYILDSYNMVYTTFIDHFHAFRKERIRSLGLKFPPVHSTMGSFEKLNLTTLVVQSVEANQACNKAVISKSII